MADVVGNPGFNLGFLLLDRTKIGTEENEDPTLPRLWPNRKSAQLSDFPCERSVRN